MAANGAQVGPHSTRAPLLCLPDRSQREHVTAAGRGGGVAATPKALIYTTHWVSAVAVWAVQQSGQLLPPPSPSCHHFLLQPSHQLHLSPNPAAPAPAHPSKQVGSAALPAVVHQLAPPSVCASRWVPADIVLAIAPRAHPTLRPALACYSQSKGCALIPRSVFAIALHLRGGLGSEGGWRWGC